MNPLSIHLKRRALLAAVALLAAPALAWAQTPIKFQLDWRFEGPAALFLASQAKGYYKAAGLDVTIDAGNGCGGTVTRVASGSYDMGFADLAALMEFHANNPDAPNKPVILLALAKTGKALRPASNTGAPIFLPFKSDGLVMPDFFRAITDAGVLL